MKYIKTYVLYLIALCSIFAACKKDKNTFEEDKLPPITQIGANTFGCLVNGKVYIPKGSAGTTKPNLRKDYDTFQGDTYLFVDTYRYVDNNFDGEFFFSIHNVINIGNYYTTSTSNRIIYGGKFFDNCGIYVSDTTTYRSGLFSITKLDLVSGIISGIFNCKIKPNNCDTIKITEGRFDFKL